MFYLAILAISGLHCTLKLDHTQYMFHTITLSTLKRLCPKVFQCYHIKAAAMQNTSTFVCFLKRPGSLWTYQSVINIKNRELAHLPRDESHNRALKIFVAGLSTYAISLFSGFA